MIRKHLRRRGYREQEDGASELLLENTLKGMLYELFLYKKLDPPSLSLNGAAHLENDPDPQYTTNEPSKQSPDRQIPSHRKQLQTQPLESRIRQRAAAGHSSGSPESQLERTRAP
jgi:hypothetical protein